MLALENAQSYKTEGLKQLGKQFCLKLLVVVVILIIFSRHLISYYHTHSISFNKITHCKIHSLIAPKTLNEFFKCFKTTSGKTFLQLNTNSII